MRITEPYTILLRTLPVSKKKVYYYQFRMENGNRSPLYSTGTDKLASARRICNELYRSGKLKKSNSLLFSSYAQNFFEQDSEYLKWKIANGTPIAPETLRAYRRLLNILIMPYFSEFKIQDITVDIVKKWIVWASEKWAAKTINNAQSVLNMIFNSAIEKNILVRNPCALISFRKTHKKHRLLLTSEELRMIYNYEWATETVKKAFLLACITGMRIGEIVGLQKEDIHENYLDVSHSLGRSGLGSTKTNQCRNVPVPSDFEFPATNSQWVFESRYNGVPIQSHAIYNSFMRLLDKIGIDKKERGITIHSLRNFFISYMQKENVPEPKIRAVVGHAEETMTDLYTYWKPDMFPEVYEKQKKLYDFIRGAT